MPDSLDYGQAVCGYCMKVYEIQTGKLCRVCGDICCDDCFTDAETCPDCEEDSPE
ncbi:MAG: hypothetical protein IT205_03080 [Fimbriimonadaceae bacterium]|nr:hypothetical protein [Fimbriimonadaceae bacterium]